MVHVLLEVLMVDTPDAEYAEWVGSSRQESEAGALRRLPCLWPCCAAALLRETVVGSTAWSVDIGQDIRIAEPAGVGAAIPSGCLHRHPSYSGGHVRRVSDRGCPGWGGESWPAHTGGPAPASRGERAPPWQRAA